MPLADEQGDAAPPAPTSDIRALAREIFLDTLAECSVPAAFQRNVEYDHGVLRMGKICTTWTPTRACSLWRSAKLLTR